MIPDKLQEAINLCGIPPNEHESFLEVVSDRWKKGYREEALWSSLCDHGYSELREVTAGDETSLLELLEKFVEKGANIRLQDTNYYLIVNERTGVVKINEKLFADDLTAAYYFKTIQDTEEVIYYKDGYYHYEGEAIVGAECERVFGEHIKTRNVTEILNHIRRATYINRNVINQDKTVLPLQNGLFDLTTHSLKSFSPSTIITYKLPVEYNTNADCPRIKNFIAEILNPEDIPIVQEYFGYTLLPAFPAHKSLWLYGIGRNGKSQLTLLLSKMLGDENTVSVPIEEFDGWHRFSTARLFGKLLNVTSEPGVEKPLKSGLFKKVVGGDRISAEIKGKQKTIDFVNFSKFIVLGNIFPQVTDPSLAFWDRLIVVEFPNSFVDKFIPDIAEKLIEEDGGLSGFFNWCLKGLKRLEKNNFKFTTTKNTEDMKLEFEKLSNPIMAFIKEECVVSVEKIVPKGELYNAYKDYCGDGNYKIAGKSEFSKQIGELRGVDGKKARYDRKVTWCWIGITLQNNVDITTENVDIAQSPLTGDKNTNKETNGEKDEMNVETVANVASKKKSETLNVDSDFEESKKNRTVYENGNNDNNGNTSNEKENPTSFVNIKDLDEKGNAKPHKKDDKTFQATQSREARARMKAEGMIE